MRELAEGELGVGHFETRKTRGQAAVVRDRGHRALVARLGDEVVGIEVVALERHEEVAGLQRAGVRVHALHFDGAVAHEAALHPGGGALEVEHAGHFLALSAACACAWSENGCLTPAISW